MSAININQQLITSWKWPKEFRGENDGETNDSNQLAWLSGYERSRGSQIGGVMQLAMAKHSRELLDEMT